MIRLCTFFVAVFIGLVGCSGHPDPAPLMDPQQNSSSDSQNATQSGQNFNYSQESQDGDNQYF